MFLSIKFYAFFAVLLMLTSMTNDCGRTKSFGADEITRTGWPAPPTSEECWSTMPAPTSGAGQQLPSWIRMVAREMPKTAAAFLELDHAHRALGPVEPNLRAAMRWVAAHANGCDNTMKIASFDAQLARVNAGKWQSLIEGDHSKWSEKERAALSFAFGMTQDSDRVTDKQFAELVQMFDERVVAAMVLHLAYANFQDRLIYCLGVQLDKDEPVRSVEVRFSPESLVQKTLAPSRTPPKHIGNPDGEPKDIISETDSHTWLPYNRLQERLQIQRARKTRLRIPDWQEFAGKLPKGLMPTASDIVWYKIALGYAHELAVPFETYMRTAGSEISINWDRPFGNCLFWMVTDSIKCPYCMGHCEMNWEVAGFNREKIEDISQRLAGNDWSSFSTAEQKALDFARTLTRAPAGVTKEHLDALRSGFGDQRAFFIMVNTSRYNYMTRISNGFQLTLETGNPFYQYYDMSPPKASEVATTPRPTPVHRDELKKLLEDMKNRTERVSLPPLSDEEKSQNDARASSYESRLSQLFLPNTSGARGYLNFGGSPSRTPNPATNRPSQEPDTQLTLDYGFKTRLFWIASRVNNCQYCLGHQESKLLAVGMSDEQIAALDLTTEKELDLSELTRARIAWVIARQNGAWYSLAEADAKMLAIGQNREQILNLENFETVASDDLLTPRDKSLLTVAKNLAASPVVLTDEEAQLAISVAGPREFVQTVHYTAMRSLLDRFTEASLLPID